MRDRCVWRKIASRKNLFDRGECAFVGSVQLLEASRESAYRYDKFVSGRSVYLYVDGNPISKTDPLGLWNILVGGGLSGVAGIGAEASGGAYISSHEGNAEVGGFASVGGGGGLNISGGGFIGVIPGPVSNIPGETVNYNIGVGPGAVTILTDPKTGEVIGITVGVGPSVTPVAVSITRSLTGKWPLNPPVGPKIRGPRNRNPANICQ